MPQQWVVIVPVKELTFAKTRLGQLTPKDRGDFALATARDVVAAARGCPLVAAVFVVTNDALAATTLVEDGARVIADVSDNGLNPALENGARVATGWHPRSGVAAVSSDLAGLTSAELAAALGAAVAARCFVTDEEGTGTTMLTAAAGVPLAPAFGADSRQRHLRSGAVELSGEWPGLRCDVDTAEDLARARARPLGAHTSRLLERLRLPA
ncbi:MAG: 2-phospho-L-lactate guanylyltransferase [Mycobacteriales bacterium]